MLFSLISQEGLWDKWARVEPPVYAQAGMHPTYTARVSKWLCSFTFFFNFETRTHVAETGLQHNM